MDGTLQGVQSSDHCILCCPFAAVRSRAPAIAASTPKVTLFSRAVAHGARMRGVHSAFPGGPSPSAFLPGSSASSTWCAGSCPSSLSPANWPFSVAVKLITCNHACGLRLPVGMSLPLRIAQSAAVSAASPTAAAPSSDDSPSCPQAVLGGNANPSADDIKKILGAGAWPAQRDPAGRSWGSRPSGSQRGGPVACSSVLRGYASQPFNRNGHSGWPCIPSSRPQLLMSLTCAPPPGLWLLPPQSAPTPTPPRSRSCWAS